MEGQEEEEEVKGRREDREDKGKGSQEAKQDYGYDLRFMVQCQCLSSTGMKVTVEEE